MPRAVFVKQKYFTRCFYYFAFVN